MADVFLSFNQRDRAFAKRLTLDLTAQSISVWTVDAVRPGENWTQIVNKEIANAGCFLAILSPHSKLNSFSSTELIFALAKREEAPSNRKIIPVICTQPPEIPFFLGQFKAYDLSTDANYEQNFAALVTSIRTASPNYDAEKYANDIELLTRQIEIERQNYELQREVTQERERSEVAHFPIIAFVATTIVLAVAAITALSNVSVLETPVLALLTSFALGFVAATVISRRRDDD